MLPVTASSPRAALPTESTDADAAPPSVSLPNDGSPRASAHRLFCDDLNSFHERVTLKSTTSPAFTPRSANGTTSSAVQFLKSERPFHCAFALHALSPSRLSSKLPTALSANRYTLPSFVFTTNSTWSSPYTSPSRSRGVARNSPVGYLK